MVAGRRYQIERALRKHIWIANCQTVGRVILKLAKSEEFKSFEREVNFQIDFFASKHIRRILDVISTPDHDFEEDFEAAIVLEYKPWTLWDACTDPRYSRLLTDRKILQVMKGALQGLADMHEQGVAHLDIKPGNILVNSDFSQVELCDLRTAFKMPPLNGWLDSSRMRGSFYTPTYRPPELFQLSICQTSADVYALGLLWLQLFQMREKPFISGLYQNDATLEGTVSKIKDSQFYDFGLAELPFYRSIKSWPSRVEGRDNEFERALSNVPNVWRVVIRAMMNPQPLERPTAAQILKNLSMH